jgi:hypothetical protein
MYVTRAWPLLYCGNLALVNCDALRCECVAKKNKTTTTSEPVVRVKGGAGRVRAEPETSPYHQSKDWVTLLSASISVGMLALLAPLGVHDAVHVGGRMHM